MDRIDSEPPEPWLTLPEVLIVGGLIAFAVGGIVLWRCHRASVALKQWFDETLGGF